MELTPKGYQAEMFDRREKEKLAQNLTLGYKDIHDYIKGPVCYDVVAYVLHLQNPKDITYTRP